MGYRDEGHLCARFFQWLTPMCRVCGLATAVANLGVGSDIVFHRHYFGVYILVVGFLLFFLETTWVVTVFLGLCISDDSNSCLRYWDYVLQFDKWKKSLLYICLAIFMFMEPRSMWLALISGSMLLLLSILYLLVTYKGVVETKESLLGGSEDQPYDRFEDIPDDFDDSLPDPMNEDTVASQDAIMQV